MEGTVLGHLLLAQEWLANLPVDENVRQARDEIEAALVMLGTAPDPLDAL